MDAGPARDLRVPRPRHQGSDQGRLRCPPGPQQRQEDVGRGAAVARPRLHLPDGLRHERLGHLRVRGPGRADDPQGRLHQPAPGHPAPRDRLLRGFRGARDRGAGGLQDPGRRGAATCNSKRRSSPLSLVMPVPRPSQTGEEKKRKDHREQTHVRTVPPFTKGHAQGRPRGCRDRRLARHPASERRGAKRTDQDRHAAGA